MNRHTSKLISRLASLKKNFIKNRVPDETKYDELNKFFSKKEQAHLCFVPLRVANITFTKIFSADNYSSYKVECYGETIGTLFLIQLEHSHVIFQKADSSELLHLGHNLAQPQLVAIASV